MPESCGNGWGERGQDTGLPSFRLFAETQCRQTVQCRLTAQCITAAVPAKTKVQPVKTASKAQRGIQKQPAGMERCFQRRYVSYTAQSQSFWAGSITVPLKEDVGEQWEI
jgi:hypothetical protein